MSVLTKDVQILEANGLPTFAIIPFPEYQQICKKLDEHEVILGPDDVPHEVVKLSLGKGFSPAKAWRVYLRLTQVEAADRLGITQGSLSHIENSDNLKSETAKKLAVAYEIYPEQLDF